MFDVSQKRLVQSLEEAARVFREVVKPAPPVVVINQMPPSQPSRLGIRIRSYQL